MSVALHPSSLITRFFTSKPFSFFFVPETKIISFLFESFFSQQCSTIWKLLLFRYIFFYLLLLLIFLYFASAPLDALRDRFITLFSHADTTKQKTKKRLSSASSSLSLSFHLLFWVPCFFPLYRWRWLFISSVQWNTFAERERERKGNIGEWLSSLKAMPCSSCYVSRGAIWRAFDGNGFPPKDPPVKLISSIARLPAAATVLQSRLLLRTHIYIYILP